MQNPDATTRQAALSQPAPLIGRDQEIAALKAAAAAVHDSGARAVTLVGPNGVGKTRLIDHVTSELPKGEGGYRVYRGSAKKSTVAFAMFAALLRDRFGLSPNTSADESKARIREQVSKVLEDRKVGDVCYFIGQLLDLPFPDSPLTKAVSEDAMQGQLLSRAVLRTFFESDAAIGPVCLVFEDLDAASDDSIALVAYLVEHLSGNVLVICSARPELLTRRPDWFELGDERHRRVDLGPIPDEVAERIMQQLLRPCSGRPPAALIEAGVRLAAGNAGLLEAIVQIYLDTGVLEPETRAPEAPRWKAHLERLDQVELPDTVEDTVSMRIAALSSAERRLLEHAACMGNVFWLGGLLALARFERTPPTLWQSQSQPELDRLQDLLDLLQRRDYVLRMPSATFAGEVEYVFKHTLEREKLEALMSADKRQSYHQTIADWITSHDSVSSVREHQVLLAHHLDRAGSHVRAALSYLDAGDAARLSYAALEAGGYYKRGLALLGRTDSHRRIEALHNHGDVLVLLGRTEEALGAFQEMLELAYRLDLRAKGGAAHNRIGRIYRAMGALGDALRHLETGLDLFRSVGDERGVAACHDDVGKVLWTKGEYEKALDRMKQALEVRKQLGDRRSIALSWHNIGIVWRDHGRPNRAREALEASLTLRREIGDLVGVSQTLNSMGKLAQDQRDLQGAKELFRQAHEVAREVGERNHIAVVLTNLGEVHYRLGDSEEAIRILKEAEELCDELGDRLHLAEAKRGLAKAYLMQNELRKARSSIKYAVDLFGQVRSKSHLATALRTLGEITAAGAWGAVHEGRAVDYFMRSIALCKEIGNELEIAKSYRSFSDYVARSEHYKNNAEIQREAKKLREMADEIFERQKIRPEGEDA